MLKPYLLSGKYPMLNKPLDNSKEIIDDLNITALTKCAGRNDKFVQDAFQRTLLCPTTDKDEIIYRQEVMKDFVSNRTLVESAYVQISNTATTLPQSSKKQKSFDRNLDYAGVLKNEADKLHSLVTEMCKLVELLSRGQYESRGFIRFFDAVKEITVISQDYFELINDVRNITEGSSFILTADIGCGLVPTSYNIVRIKETKSAEAKKFHAFTKHHKTLKRISSIGMAPQLSEIRDMSMKTLADILSSHSSALRRLFCELRSEMAFYIGALRLFALVKNMGYMLCYPEPIDASTGILEGRNLVDITLVVQEPEGKTIEPNNVGTSGKTGVIITGRNQGGKTTFLRSIALAQLLMQSGLYVPAETYRSSLCDRIYTLFAHEEDRQKVSGRLEDELIRARAIITNVNRDSMVFMNEPFASTTEREGSEILFDIVKAFINEGIRVFCVTHLYTFAKKMYDTENEKAMNLLASHGENLFIIEPGKPIATSHADELWKVYIAG